MMHTQLTTPMDPRDPPVLEVLDYPDPPLRLVVSHAPREAEAETAASVLLAKQAQQRERAQAIADNLDAASLDLVRTCLLDSVHVPKVAATLCPDLTEVERNQAAAVAIRLHDPQWDAIARYRAAEAVLLSLRNLLSRHGLGALVPDAELRQEADRIAGLTHHARLRVYTGKDGVSDTLWTKARLHLLNIAEEG